MYGRGWLLTDKVQVWHMPAFRTNQRKKIKNKKKASLEGRDSGGIPENTDYQDVTSCDKERSALGRVGSHGRTKAACR